MSEVSDKKRYLSVYAKGLGMGAADIVPGVSGGTIAFITGIYEELLNSLRSISPAALKILFNEGIGACWKHINGNFLLSLMAGVITSFLSLAHVISYLLASYPLLVWSFFFGLVLASAVHISKELSWKNWQLPLLTLVGFAIAFFVTSVSPAHVEPALWKIFAAGALAICAMILPGISGSFILVLLGLYSVIIDAIKSLDVATMLVFAAGCGIGLLSFVHVLSWLFSRFKQQTIAVLTGFLLGSLNALWPWKHVLEYYQSSKGLKPLVQENVLPSNYHALTGIEPMLMGCIAMLLLGLALVFVIEKVSNKT